MTFDVWCEGYILIEQKSRAIFLGRVEGAQTFEDACRALLGADPFFSERTNPLTGERYLAFYGCRLFDNEHDAREFERRHADIFGGGA